MTEMKNFFSIICMLAAMLTISCSNDDVVNNTANKVNAAKDIKFEISFSDYNTDDTISHGTRAAIDPQVQKTQIVPMGEMMYAEVSLQRDTTKTINKVGKAMTRALTDGTYTIYAYQGTSLKGTLKGTVTSNVFTPTSSNEEIGLEPGTYTFVCCNEKVQVNGETWSIDRSDVENARIGIAKDVVITPTPRKQKVAFQMKHVGSRVKVVMRTDGFPPRDVTGNFSSTLNIPSKINFNTSTQTYAVTGTVPFTDNITFTYTTGAAWTNEPTAPEGWNDYYYFLPKTNGANLKFTITGGTAYRLPITGRSVTFPALASMSSNDSYRLVMKVHYNYIYLFSDGTTGQKTDANFSSKTPIAVVVSRSKRIAAAIKDIDPSAISNFKWGKDNVVTTNTASATLSNHLSDLKGYDYTYSTTYSTDGIIKGNDAINYPAFYAAAHYDAGVPITGANIGKWYLPSIGEWNLYFKNLVYFSNEDIDYLQKPSPGSLNDMISPDTYALKFTSQISRGDGQCLYASSSELSASQYYAYCYESFEHQTMMGWPMLVHKGKNMVVQGNKSYDSHMFVRPFVHY